MLRKSFFLALVLILLLSGCSFKEKIVKYIPIEQMDDLKEKYVGRTAWTRVLLIDLGTEGIIDRDTKVEIVDLDMHWNGAITVKGPNRKKITHGLKLTRPMTRESFEQSIERCFWFIKPDKRYRLNLRKYGKRTAKAIYNHELFKGMKREAALESWGYPDMMKETEMSGSLEEQWIYRDPRQKTKKRYVYIIKGIVDSWEE
jgi:hypothetical protein